jgi:hypothetical protein
MLGAQERRPDGCAHFGCGITLLLIGVLTVLVGCFWHYPPLTATTGVIVDSQPLAAVPSHLITYEYEANGVRHRGQRVWRYESQFKAFYQVGRPFPVYFVTAHPEVSYGPNKPLSLRLVFAGIFLATLSGAIMFLGRRG